MARGTLVGRDAELNALLRAVHETFEGDSTTAVVAGEPGIGKTFLLGVLRDRVEELGALVLTGRASEFEALPFGVLIDADVNVDGKRNADGQVCTSRDALQSRSGASCQVTGFRQIIEIGDQLVGPIGDPAGGVGVGGAAVRRVVLESAVLGWVVRRGDDDPVRQVIVPAPIRHQDRQRDRRGGYVPAGSN